LERALLQLKSSGRHLPQSLLGIAIDYALGQSFTPSLKVAVDAESIRMLICGMFSPECLT